jgi:hypothetical protein
MKHTLPPQFKVNLFGICGNKTPTETDPTDFHRTNFKPCVTEKFVNVIYNAYLDAVDCYGLPAKNALPKFMNESGVMPNLVASNSDAGLSQFSTASLRMMARDYEKWSPRILNSKKPSCQRLVKYPGAMPRGPEQIVADDHLKCHIIDIPANPVRNFIYYGAFYHIIKNDVAMIFNRSQSIDPETGEPRSGFKSTATLLSEAGIENFSKDVLSEIFIVMSYNTGPKSVIYFKEWLQYRLEKFPDAQILKKDIDMTIRPNPWLDFDKLTKEQLLEKYDQGGTRAMAFWEWLAVYKNKFRYASYIKFYANRLDDNFGKGVCSPDKYLSLE